MSDQTRSSASAPHGGSPRAAPGWLSGLQRAVRLVWDTHSGLTILVALTTTGQAVIPAATAWASKLVIEGVLAAAASRELSWRGVIPALTFAAGVAIAGLVLRAVSQAAQDVLRERLTHRVNSMIVRKAMGLDLEFFEAPHKQDMLQRAASEASFRPLAVLQGSFALVQGTITLFFIVALLLRFSVWVFVLLAFTGLPALYVQTRFSRESFSLVSSRAPLWRRLMYYSSLLTHHWHCKEVKLFGLGGHLYDRYDALYRRFTRENTSLALRRSCAAVVLELLGLVGYYGAYMAVIGQALRGRVGIGDLALYAGLLAQAPGVVQSLMHTISGLYESNLFLGNLYALLAAQPRIAPGDGTGARAPTVLQQGVVFENVSFRYPGGGDYVLRDISLTIRPGEKIAIVGQNGAGKTTLIKLLTRLYDPTCGRITLDGLDLAAYEPSSLHSRVAVIFQDFARYNLTARENIGFGQVEALEDHQRILDAARTSGAHDIIETLPRGYESTLGRWFADSGEDEGVDLSFGEWQKVALARAFMRDAPILVLDEPTASLDARAEHDLYRRFRDLAAHRMAILVSHRFSTVRMADRIVVIERGRIVEQGTHEDLLAAAGQYAALFNLQAQPYR